MGVRRGLGRGLLFVLRYNPAMPAKNIITNQPVTKEKLQRAKELPRKMTPAEKTAKRVGRVAGKYVGSPLSEAAGHSGIHR
jgi:hypothetical protein